MKYLKIWSQLEKEIEDTGKSKFKSPNNKCITEVFFTVDEKTLARSVLIEINKSEVTQISKLPEINGWTHSVELKKISGQQKSYLKIIGNSLVTNSISEIVIGDLNNKIFELKNRDQLFDSIVTALKQWMGFFSSSNEMTQITEQGLVGELSFLHEMIVQGSNMRDVIENWTGSDKSRHDFEFKDKHFEIKTTTRKDRHVKISSEHQLNNKGLKQLYLVVYKFNKIVSSMPSLPELYEKMFSLTQNDPDLQNRILEQCAKLGYNHSKKGLYKNRFELDDDIEIYLVEDKFPKLLKTPKMLGIDNISYSLDLDVCQNFRIDKTIVLPI
jgi:hypothetical protein